MVRARAATVTVTTTDLSRCRQAACRLIVTWLRPHSLDFISARSAASISGAGVLVTGDHQPDRNGDRERHPIGECHGRFVYRAAQPFCDNLRLGPTGGGQGDEEFFSSDSGQKVGGAQIGGKTAGNLDQHGIARRMSPGVVHRLEPVEIEHHHREFGLVNMGTVGNRGQLRQTVAAVVQPGQRVEHCQPQPVLHR